ncbi:MAG TPA: sigma-70 family RNA polymerase sigma factor [Gemmataceae bacterium]|nr:sigma-70 family RNA polymerase sigma factor [Gemmataceae bacterium]
MPEEPATRPSLLVRLRDHQDNQAWGEFVELYAPLIYAHARKRGLQDADAADLTQNCLRQVAVHVGRLEYDRQRGSFRGWLFTIVRNKLRDFQRQPRRLHQGSGEEHIQQLLERHPASEPEEQEEWDREYRLGLLSWAAEQVRPQVQEATWQAFWQTAIEGKSGTQVAHALGMTAAAVYLAKSRVMTRLRDVIREVQGEEDTFA